MSLYIPVIFVSVLYISISYFINQDNAKFLLSGYNTMSEDEKNRFDLINYLKFFRKFMLYVSIYTAIIYFISTIFFNIETSAIIYAIAVCIPWPYFIIISNKRFIK